MDKLETLRLLDTVEDSFRSALKELKSARNWGIFDMISGGAIITFIKRRKLDKAQGELNRGKRAISQLKLALTGTEGNLDLMMEDSQFLTFADYLFDNPITDFLVQQNINKNMDSIETALEDLDELRRKIENY